MKNNIYFVIVISVVVFFTNCTQSPPNFMALDEISYVHTFPQTFSIENAIVPNIDIIGINGFVIYDSLLIFSTSDKEGLWSFISLPNYNYIGKFLKAGQGPFEFIQAPTIHNKVKLADEDDQLFAYIYDFHRGKILKMNISTSLSTDTLQIFLDKDSFPPFLFNLVVIDSTKFLCKEINNEQTQQLRYIINSNNEKIIPDFMQNLNQAAIKKGEDINILSTMTKYCDDHQMIVEMPIGLNYINMYTLDDSFGKTICTGKNMDNIDKIQDIEKFDRLYTYSSLSLFKDFFGVVCINEDEKTYQTKRTKLPSILLFDWQGIPLAELKLNRFITSFDIDFNYGYLYTLDVHSDEFLKYDINDILTKLNKTK